MVDIWLHKHINVYNLKYLQSLKYLFKIGLENIKFVLNNLVIFMFQRVCEN